MATFALPFMPASSSKSAALFAGKAWQQVLARDTRADGQFVYAVKSTGIYCRPSCPSRKPERRNVSFFPSTDAAESAGFRACLRCEPLRVAPRPDPQAAAIARAADFLVAHASERTSMEAVAQAAGVGKFAVLRGFKRVLGVTPGEFLRAQRKESFRTKVRPAKSPATTKPRITDALLDAGFQSPSRLYTTADQTLGMTPTAMRAGGAGETIRYTVTASPLGRILVAATETGLCAVLFADTDALAAAELRDRFPQAVLRPSNPDTKSEPDTTLAAHTRQVLAQLRESPSALTLPFHVRATAFQQRVWAALLAIPRGETRTYAQIATAIGAPKSVRAVGTACGANPLAVVVPCHRVVGANGALTGYRWGTPRKRQLLTLESHPTP